MVTNLSHRQASHVPERRTQSERQNLGQKKISTQPRALTVCVFPLTNPSSIQSLPCHTDQEFSLAKTGPLLRGKVLSNTNYSHSVTTAIYSVQCHSLETACYILAPGIREVLWPTLLPFLLAQVL